MKKMKLLAAVLMTAALTVFAVGCGSTESKEEPVKEEVKTETAKADSDSLFTDKGFAKVAKDITGIAVEDITADDLASIESLVIVGNKVITDEAIVAEIVSADNISANDWNNYVSYTVNGEEKKYEINFAHGSIKSLEDVKLFTGLKNLVVLESSLPNDAQLPEGISLDKFVVLTVEVN